jgi:hypothetical protein
VNLEKAAAAEPVSSTSLISFAASRGESPDVSHRAELYVSD